MPYNSVADSFHAKKLCSRHSRLKQINDRLGNLTDKGRALHNLFVAGNKQLCVGL